MRNSGISSEIHNLQYPCSESNIARGRPVCPVTDGMAYGGAAAADTQIRSGGRATHIKLGFAVYDVDGIRIPGANSLDG